MRDNEQKHENRETLAGIVAEMRSGKLSATVECENCGDEQERRFTFNGLADRIKAAWKREKAEVEANALEAGGIVEAARKREREPVTERHAIGNAAAMREALVGIRYLIADEPDGTPMIDAMKAMTDAALAAPARNCDVGTAEDQKARMLEYCKSHKNVDGIIICERCPHHGPNWTWCALRWGQMPYEEGGAK